MGGPGQLRAGDAGVMKRNKFVLVALVGLWCLACGDELTDAQREQASSPQTVWDVASEEPELSHWLDAARAAGLESVLAGPGPITVLAPTNDAFEDWQTAQGDGKFDAGRADEGVLGAIVERHVLDGRVSGEQIFRRRTLDTWAGPVTIEITTDRATVGGAMISSINLEASNGIIHIIESMVTAP